MHVPTSFSSADPLVKASLEFVTPPLPDIVVAPQAHQTFLYLGDAKSPGLLDVDMGWHSQLTRADHRVDDERFTGCVSSFDGGYNFPPQLSFTGPFSLSSILANSKILPVTN